MSNNQEPSGPFHAGPGTAHEIGVMVAFMAAIVIITLVNLVMWKVGNKRGEAQEKQRRQKLPEKTNPRNTGVMDDKSGARHSVAPGY